MNYLIIAGLFLVVLIIILIGFYNKFIKLRNMLLEAWSLIDIQLKQRYDIIPNLIETVKSYTKHESSVLDEITRLRTRAMETSAIKDKEISEKVLTDKIAEFFISVENYPDLKANQNFLELQKQLMEIEDKIQLARRYYNGAVRNYNIATETFPGNLLSALYRFEKYSFFELDSIDERRNIVFDFK